MGREVRMVPADWVHPKYDENHPEVIAGNDYLIGRYIPKLAQSYEDAVIQWESEDLPEYQRAEQLWAEGFVMSYAGSYEDGKKKIPIDEFVTNWNSNPAHDWHKAPENPTFDWWMEEPDEPNPEYYMPNWKDEETTHFMMYENTSEGTPISPAFATPEELATWLADTGASSFADYTATYEQWLSTINRGFAVSAVMDGNGFRSGVEAQA